MIHNDLISPEDRVRIDSWEHAQFFFDFYKERCGATHKSVNEKNWSRFPYFQLQEDKDIVGWMSSNQRYTYAFSEWFSQIHFYEENNKTLQSDRELLSLI